MTKASLADLHQLIEREILFSVSERTAKECISPRLKEALKYALSSKGKRLRPLLVLGAAISSGQGELLLRHALPAACAVEYVHTYSLIHDDLPCMDDDDYRRGRPTLHRRFDEALAVLAGDALLADAFFLSSLSKNNAILITRELALTAGSSGLVAGQAEDLLCTSETKLSHWQKLNSAKTARLFEAAAAIGGYVSCASDTKISALRKFGHSFGVAFQVKDDLDDQSGLARFQGEAKIMLEENLSAAKAALNELSAPETLHELLHLAFATAV